ncbi:MAG: toast rack family protein, partial [Longimicrobiales bacterium]
MSRRAALALVGAFVCASPAAAQEWRTITQSRQAAGEDLLRVDVEYGAGRFVVSPGATSLLYYAKLRYDAEVFRPTTSYTDGRLKLGFEGGNLKGRNFKAGQLDLQLGTSIPLDLQLKFGAVEADVELGGLRIREANIATGASKTSLRVSQPNP